MTISYSDTVKDAKNDAVEVTIGTSPKLRIYSGSVPANASASLGAAVLLAEGSLPSDWMSNSSGGVKSKTGTWTLTGQSGAGAGTAGTFYRVYDSAGTTSHEQGTFTASGGGGDMTIDNNSIANAQSITVATYTKTAGN